MTSVTGTCSRPAARGRHPRSAGFTLVELMVVLLIIGVIITFAGISLRGDPWDGSLREETRRLAALLDLAAEDAMLVGRELAVRFESDGYRFLHLQQGEWTGLADPGALRPRQLPPGMELELRLLEGGPAMDPEEDGPQVYILSSGEMTPFILRLQTPERAYRYELRADLFGQLDWEGPLP